LTGSGRPGEDPSRTVNVVDPLRRSPQTSGVFLDFDGSLSEIVARPEVAVAVEEAAETLTVLADAYAVVAVVSGRPSAEVRERLAAPGVEVFGLYGLEEPGGPAAMPANERETLLGEVMRCVDQVPGARLEDKGSSFAVHFRGVEDPHGAERRLLKGLRPIATRTGMVVLPGKMVLELAPASTPGKGAVVLREARSRGLTGILYAGDDLADLDAFAAVDRLWGEGLEAVKVAVGGPESPAALLAAADVVVDGPTGLLALLQDLLPTR
jgi:trehalose 6-phosphate phosphatase